VYEENARLHKTRFNARKRARDAELFLVAIFYSMWIGGLGALCDVKADCLMVKARRGIKLFIDCRKSILHGLYCVKELRKPY